MVERLPADAIRLIARKRPLSSDRLEQSFQPGMTLAEMLNDCGLDSDVVAARVTIDGRLIEQAYWEQIKPSSGQLVTVQVIPQGGDGGSKDIIRIVAMVGVLALAIAAPYLAPGAWGLAVGGSLTLAGTAVTAGLSIGGSLRLSELLSTPRIVPSLEDRTP